MIAGTDCDFPVIFMPPVCDVVVISPFYTAKETIINNAVCFESDSLNGD